MTGNRNLINRPTDDHSIICITKLKILYYYFKFENSGKSFKTLHNRQRNIIQNLVYHIV